MHKLLGGINVLDIISETIIDSLKILPFLFLTFLLMEYFEHKTKNKNDKIIKKSGKLGPLFGAILGVIPQCGFSVAVTNLYATRIVSLGTLISVYLSTSDEMLPILISERASIDLILKIILIKVIVGMFFGFIIDLLIKRKEEATFHDFCNEKHCGCNHGILKSSIKHTLDIFVFLIIISFLLNLGFSYLGEENLSKLFMKQNIFGTFLTSLIGLIPNCGASVILTKLYLSSAISFPALISGLLTGSGVAVLVLFKVNNNKKENFKILFTLYIIGVLVGIVFHLLNLLFY